MKMTVIEPWSWFWLPPEMNPQDFDPNFQGSARYYPDAPKLNWAGIAAAAGDGIRTAQQGMEPGVLLEEVAVAVDVDGLSEVEQGIVSSWVGDDPTSGSPTLERLSEGGWEVADGRHRLWGIAAAHARLAPNGLPAAFPVIDEAISYASGIIERPDWSFTTYYLAESLPLQLAWWENTAPAALRAANGVFVDVLRGIRDAGTSLRRA